MTPEQKKIYDIQCASTKMLMDLQAKRDPNDDLAWWMRPIPKEAQVLDEEGNVFINARSLGYSEVSTYNRMRYNAGERLAEMREDKVARAFPDEVELSKRKNSAVNAFMDIFSVDVIKERFKKMMDNMFKPSHAELVAAEMRKVLKNEK